MAERQTELFTSFRVRLSSCINFSNVVDTSFGYCRAFASHCYLDSRQYTQAGPCLAPAGILQVNMSWNFGGPAPPVFPDVRYSGAGERTTSQNTRKPRTTAGMPKEANLTDLSARDVGLDGFQPWAADSSQSSRSWVVRTSNSSGTCRRGATYCCVEVERDVFRVSLLALRQLWHIDRTKY